MSADRSELLLSNEELTLVGLASLLNATSDDVVDRERAGKLFSFVRPQRSLDRCYPIYQLAPEIGVAMVSYYTMILGPDGPTLHTFFSGQDPDLFGLTVREVLGGKAVASRLLDDDAMRLLAKPLEERMQWVEDAAQRLKNIVHGW